MNDSETNAAFEPDEPASIKEDRLWSDNGWTARVIKNEDDDGWAVAMIKDGETEPALVGPWTMGRDKKNPKPLDGNAFHVLVKTASEVLSTTHGPVEVTLDIVPDDYEPYAILSALDPFGEELAQVRVDAGFKLNRSSATKWVEGGFGAVK